MTISGPNAGRRLLGSAIAVLFAVAGAADAQSSGSARQNGAATNTSGGSTSAANPSAVSAGQTQLYNASGNNGTAITRDTFSRSVPEGQSTGIQLPLSLDDAIQRGLRNNLGVILQSSTIQSSNGQRLEQLQQLLPTITGAATVSVEQVNLAAFGLKFPGINPIIGPFQVVDFRAYLTQSVVNIAALQSYIGAKHNFAAAKLSAEDARDLVVLTVGNAYLVCVADQARIDAVNAELKTSKLSFDQATAAHDAGVSPRLDVLRAQVDYQNEQQTLISATNQLSKDKLALARVIGLPLAQPFFLTDAAPFKPLDNPDPDAAFLQALRQRKDLASDQELVRAAESARKAAIADQYPVVSISGDFGDLGTTPGHSHGTFTATGQVTAPILQLARTRGEREAADSALASSKARLSDAAQQINADIRDAILDIQSAAKLVQTTQSNVSLASEELSEAQQRFHAGVSDNLPVSQAQTQVEQANDQYISALYQHNVAKLSLARALGVAQTNYKEYLGGR